MAARVVLAPEAAPGRTAAACPARPPAPRAQHEDERVRPALAAAAAAQAATRTAPGQAPGRPAEQAEQAERAEQAALAGDRDGVIDLTAAERAGVRGRLPSPAGRGDGPSAGELEQPPPPPHSGSGAGDDGAMDRHARLVCSVLGVPAAVVSLVSKRLQLFPGAVGLPEPWQTTRLADLTRSSCQRVVAGGRPLAVRDAREVPDLASDAVVTDLGAVGYLGAPLHGPDGEALGALAALSPVPRDWTRREVALLADLAAACSAELQLRRALTDAGAVRAAAENARDAATTAQMRAVGERREAEVARAHSQLLLGLSEAVAGTRDVDEVARIVTRLAGSGLGAAFGGVALVDRPARAARFLAQEGPEPVRIALEEPSAGATSVRQRRPLYHHDAAALAAEFPRAAPSPVLAGLEGSAHVPLVVSGSTVGVLVIGWEQARTTTASERQVIAALADYTAQALQRCLLLQAERDTAQVLQAAMLTRLPSLPDLQLAAKYAPAATGHQVGGDWYDALRHPDGSTLLVIGDVTGHDTVAAAAMGQVRSALRTLAVATSDTPAQLLTRVDRTLSDLGADLMATALTARLEAPGHDGARRLVFSSAGHPPPLVAEPGGAVSALVGEAELLLGLDPGCERSDTAHVVPRGSTLLLYTDGLIERRDSDLATGLERLADALADLAHLPLPALLDQLVARLVGPGGADDVALLAVRTRPPA